MDGGNLARSVHTVEYHTAVNKSQALRKPRTWSTVRDPCRRSPSLHLNDGGVQIRRNQSLEELGWVGQGGGENVALACHVRIMAAPGDELRKTLNYYA